MSFLGGLVKGVTNILKIVPGPVGAIAGVVNRAVSGGAGAAPATQLVPASMPYQGGTVNVTGPSARGPSFSAGPGGVSFQGPSFQGPSAQVTVGGPGAMQMYRGYHQNKTLVRAQVMQMNRGGLTPGMQRAVSQVVNGTVKNRSMNVLNGRAANRAIKRVKGAMKALRRIERALPHRTVHTSGRKR